MLTLGVVGVEHRHVFGQLSGMLAVGCRCAGWWTDGEPQPVAGFRKRFPEIPRVDDRRRLLENPEIDLVLIADIPALRSVRAIEAMRAGKDVMTDKPGCTTPSTTWRPSRGRIRDGQDLVGRFLRTV